MQAGSVFAFIGDGTFLGAVGAVDPFAGVFHGGLECLAAGKFEMDFRQLVRSRRRQFGRAGRQRSGFRAVIRFDQDI